jgi:hypothetical protein
MNKETPAVGVPMVGGHVIFDREVIVMSLRKAAVTRQCFRAGPYPAKMAGK